MNRHEKFIETADFPDNTHLEISVYYSKGGTNYLTYKTEPRGFYLSVTPVKKDGVCVSHILGAGIKKLIAPANRYSAKQHDLAIAKSAESEQELIDYLKSGKKCA